MVDFINYGLMGIVVTAIHVYIWNKILEDKINFKSFKTYIFLILMVIVLIINYIYVNNYVKIASITCMFMILCKLLFNTSWNKAILVPIVSQITIAISEFIFALIFLTIIHIDEYKIFNTYVGTLLPNVIIACFAYFITKVGFTKKLYTWLSKMTFRIRKCNLFVLVLVLILTINFIQVIIYYQVSLRTLIIVNIILMFVYAFIILRLVNTKNKYLIISDKYNSSKNSLSEYQSVINRYRTDNHENKGQLRRLKNKIDPNNKVALEYIDMILNTRIKNNDKVLNKTKIIPNSDLRVLIDSKVMAMEEKNIKNSLHVDKQIKTIDFIEIDVALMEEICKIVGVYLDNAIEAVENLKEKEIQIDLYLLDKTMCISVINNYEGEIEQSKLNDAGYTTKSEGHGYGLALVSEIVENNKKLSKETSIMNGIFKQVLKIKM